MKFTQTLIKGKLIKRYKRFLADIELDDGSIITAHTPNTGSMMGCCEPGSSVWMSKSANEKRKYPLSWELIKIEPGVIVGINTQLPNKLVKEAIETGGIPELKGYSDIATEVRYGEEKSRIDLLLKKENQLCYVEIKNVTLVENDTALFPDAVSKRGTKHLRELMSMVKSGHRAVIFYCVQRSDARSFRPAAKIDPEYANTLVEAVENGVEALAYRANVSPIEIVFDRRLDITL